MNRCIECREFYRAVRDARFRAINVYTRGQSAEEALIALLRGEYEHRLRHLVDNLASRVCSPRTSGT